MNATPPIELPPSEPVTRRKTRAKGEKSRQAILTAAMVVIAKKGLHAVTHRAIAAEAGVPLSLTTYFFTSLQDLIDQTFDHFVVMTATDHAQLLAEIASFVSAVPPAYFADPVARKHLHREVCAALSRFILHESEVHSVGIAVELNYLYLFRLTEELAAKVLAYRNNLVAEIAKLIRPIVPEQPEVDASLVLGMVHRLEFDCINRPHAALREQVESEVSRLVGYILKT